MKLRATRCLGWAAALTLFGCNAIIGLEEGTPFGQGGDGGGGAPPFCTPNEIASCYDGPTGTAGVGICQEGTTTCNAEGTAWGPCEGQVLPQPEDCTTGEDEDCDGRAPPCPGEVVWQKRFGDADLQELGAVAASPLGEIAVVGRFLGSIDLGDVPLTTAPGIWSGFVGVFTPDGAHRWSRALPDAGYQIAFQEAGAVVMLVTFNGTLMLDPAHSYIAIGGTDLLLVRFDAGGEIAWARQIEGTGPDVAGGVAADGAGRVLVAGRAGGAVDAGCGLVPHAGTDDAFVAQLDPAGGCMWAKLFGNPAPQAVFAASTTGQGDVLLTGGYYETIDFGGGPLPSAGAADIFVARLSAGGEHGWSRGFGDAGFQIPSHIAADSEGGALLAGDLTGVIDFGGGPLLTGSEPDFFLARLSPAGEHLWSRRGGDGGYRRLNGLAVGAAGEALLAGTFTGMLNLGGGPLVAAGEPDGFVAMLSPDGQHRWSKRIGASTSPVHFATVAAGEGAVLGGTFSGDIDLGAGPLSSAGATDVFLVALAP